MTLYKTSHSPLTDDEWNELKALKNAINYNPSQVSPEKMEQFTSLLIRSFRENGG